MRRPTSHTIGALFLWQLAFGGFGIAFIGPLLEVQALGALYGLAAVVTGFGLWSQKVWTPKSFAVWAATALAGMIWVDIVFNLTLTVGALVFTTIAGILFFFIYRGLAAWQWNS